ncbi:protein translocase subunit SecF [Nitrococcus mobilis]|uniref:Protein-export membrane protein SecF n=1 Tax=Nitrococcus mobilis Nb-231 TaxID=314278 RepID=A4BSU3_9GAMM|nr:protein translocase subunit SecF [Nitrococcus mobilis]EAR21187.1 SecF protein [Nitrococcus mobilis Nb-231]
MDLFKRQTHINFIGMRRYATILSAILILIALVSLAVRGLNLGLDFTGGTIVEVTYPKPAELQDVRAALAVAGYPDAVVQHFGSARDVLIRMPSRQTSSAQLGDQIITALSGSGEARLSRVEFVGPQVGEQLIEKGGLAMLYTLVGVLIYVAFRFEYRFAVSSVAALIHDVIITIGFFSLFQIEFDLTVLAAVLAVIGYSLNDTIVVFDRIRENFVRMRKGSPIEIANQSINQTLSRTLVTSGTTLIVVFTLYLIGGELIAGFALALLVGIVTGTYSSVYIASTTALALGVSKQDLMPPKKEGAELEERL